MNLSETTIGGRALAPGNISNADVNGDAIVRPWLGARRIFFILIAAAMAAGDIITVRVQARRVNTSTWDNLKQSDGTTDLAFDAQADGGELEDGFITGELNLQRLIFPDSAFEYDAIRVVGINAVAQNVVVGGTFSLGWLFRHGKSLASRGNTEQLLDKQIWS